jgi:hypothetical protein
LGGSENLTSTITVVVVDWYSGAVNRYLLEVGAAMTIDLGVEVREDAALQKRVVSKVDTSHNVARLKHLGKSVGWERWDKAQHSQPAQSLRNSWKDYG